MGIMPIITLCYGQYCDNDSGQFAQPHPDALNAQKCEEVIRTILKHVKKDLTPDQAIAGMKNAKDAGIDVLLSFIFGLGGIERSKEHIVETTKLLNLLEPEEMAPMALAVQPGTELAKEIEAGQFIQATPLQILEKEKYFLENMSAGVPSQTPTCQNIWAELVINRHPGAYFFYGFMISRHLPGWSFLRLASFLDLPSSGRPVRHVPSVGTARRSCDVGTTLSRRLPGPPTTTPMQLP